MVRLRVAELLKARGWTAYRLAQEAGITIPVAYKYSRPDGRFQRLEAGTLDKLCRTLGVQPGALIEWRPDDVAAPRTRSKRPPPGGRKRGRRA